MKKQSLFAGVLAAMVGASCSLTSPPLDVEHEVVTGLHGDLFTNVSGDPASADYRFWVSTDMINAPRGAVDWSESMRVVRWSSSEPVEGVWEPRIGGGGLPNRVVFVPNTPLPNGWYALQVRLDPSWQRGLRELHITTEEGWETQRAHVGSFPVLRLDFGFVGNFVDATPTGTTMALTPTEFIAFDERVDFASALTLRVNGQPRRCIGHGETATLERGRPLTQVRLDCDLVREEDLIEIVVDPMLRPSMGPFVTVQGVSPPRWSFRMTEGPPNMPDDVEDALFEPRVNP